MAVEIIHESMGPGRDQTCDPWICSQTLICCQTCYRLRYVAQKLVEQHAASYKGKTILLL